MPFRIGVRILSGSCLPKPHAAKSGEVIDPYVTVTLHDVCKQNDGSLEYTRDSLTTSTVQDNGFCPVWDEKEHEFVVHNPQVAIVNFALKESDIALDDKVANAAIPVSVLRKGYRSVQLFNLDGTRTGPYGCATLLVQINCYDLSEGA
jgi:phosphatidylinositol phospholipase C delta